jgi:hypothetical protein
MGPYEILMVREGRKLTFKERIVDKFKNTYCLNYDLFPINGGIGVV